MTSRGTTLLKVNPQSAAYLRDAFGSPITEDPCRLGLRPGHGQALHIRRAPLDDQHKWPSAYHRYVDDVVPEQVSQMTGRVVLWAITENLAWLVLPTVVGSAFAGIRPRRA